MTPEGAMSAALRSISPWKDDDTFEEVWTNDARDIIAALDGYSLVPIADLDRLRAVERAAQDYLMAQPGKAEWSARDALRDALGDRTAEVGVPAWPDGPLLPESQRVLDALVAANAKAGLYDVAAIERASALRARSTSVAEERPQPPDAGSTPATGLAEEGR